MGSHRTAWDGMTLLVFDPEPLIPMTIEQTIASTSPWLETKVESFENYGDALEYCRNRRDVGFIIISDNCDVHNAEEVFRNLAAPYESALGWSAAGLLYSGSGLRMEGFRAMSQDNRFVDYVERDQLTNSKYLPMLLDRIWSQFVTKVETTLFPESMQRVLFSLASSEGFSQDSQSFVHRTINVMSKDLNLSWYDMMGLKWAHTFETLRKSHPTVLDANRRLTQLVSAVSIHLQSDEIYTIPLHETIVRVGGNKGIPLAGRLAVVVDILEKARQTGHLVDCLTMLKALNVPGASAILKSIVRNSSQIVKFGDQLGNEISGFEIIERAG